MRRLENITLLDCTLRDGGHLNNGVFGNHVIRRTVQELVKANVDIVEVGFLMQESYDLDTARYRTINEVKRILPKEKMNTQFSLMADFIDVNDLEPYDGTIDIIRLSFKRQRLDWAIDAAKTLMGKGYKVFINPVNCNVYTDEEYIQLLKRVNTLKPYGFSIVDTFGVLRKEDLSRLYYLVENNLDIDICIGIHLHENLGCSFLLAQHYLEIHNPNRRINIDGSLLGMGRAPGNLCIEQIMDYMNEHYNSDYVLEPALDLINDYIQPLKEEIEWGYSIPYYLSAKFCLHRTYAEYLINKWKLGMKDIRRILSQVDKCEAEYFNEEYIEDLYQKYIRVSVDDSENIKKIKQHLFGNKIIVIAPGKSIENYICEINSIAGEENTCIISVGFIPDFVACDFAFFTSIKRYQDSCFYEKNTNIIISSNILKNVSALSYDYVVDYNRLICHGDITNDNSMLMLFNLVRECGINEIYIAGFDGINSSKNNYYGEIVNRDRANMDINIQVDEVIRQSYSELKINFITPSMFDGKHSGMI